MGIQAKSSQEQVLTGGKKYTGLANMMVVGISPSLEEIKAKGGRTEKEPEYTTNEFVEEKRYEGPEGSYIVSAYNYYKTRIDINLFIAQYKYYNKLAIWIEDRPRWNRNHTKVEWINRFGTTAWTLDEQILEQNQLEVKPDYKWFSSEGARPALGGEGQVTQFIKAWANVGLEDQAALDKPQTLAKGDFNELRNLWKSIPTNEVKILNGVRKVEKDGKINYYSAAYSGYFSRANVLNYADWKNALAGEYGKFEADYQNDLVWREWIGDSRVEGDSPTDLNIPSVSTQGANSGTPGTPGAPAFTF